MTGANPYRRSTELLDSLRGLHPRLIDLSLDRIRTLLEKLGNPEKRFPPVIHVAGTNGKGSTVAFIQAIARAAGLRVHVYSSPHLISFHERIVLAAPDGGESLPISEDHLVDVLERVRTANAGAQMTFYEMTSAAAFLAFAETPADLLVLEVGLGGRLDASNVVADPAAAVITPIAMDHMAELGNTLEAIAAEKAGILKPGAPAVIGPQAGAALDVIIHRGAGDRGDAGCLGRALRCLPRGRPPRLSG
jgi:dihydrofolate synthase/folylpolyglutamate synthase